MWLFVESTRPDRFTVGLLSKETPQTWVVEGRSNALLAEVMRRTKGKKLQGICVVSGPGSFTSTRTGVVIANVLSRELHLPLVGVSLDEVADLPTLASRLNANAIAPMPYVAPVYSSEPNITIKHV